MRLQIYDPRLKHDYVSKMYFDPMLEFAQDNGMDVQRASNLVPTTGVGMICDADYLTPQVILHFKENDCQLFGFSCIDSAYLPEVLRYSPDMLMVNRLFMVSGVPAKNFSNATLIDGQFNIATEKRKYLPDDAWSNFDFMRERGAIQSLPYLIWNRIPIPQRRSFEDLRPSILFRGGAHFLRVIAFFMALKNGCADEESGFWLRDYFREDMNPQFRYCDECRREFAFHGMYPLGVGTGDECKSIAKWGDELDLSNPGVWNNRCPKSYYWLAEQFAARHGAIDMDKLCRAMNFESAPEEQHRRTVGSTRFYADCKWEFSIYAAQRFWEAASVGTINLLPRRANDQDYFPAMRDGEHYMTFSDDLSDVSADISKEQFEHVSENAYQLWKKWIKPDKYITNTNLLQHIFDTIQTPRDT